MEEELDIEKQLEETPSEPSSQEPSSEKEEVKEEKEAATAGEKEGEGAAPSTGTVSILGREYDLSKPDQVQELAKDYERLGRMYAPLLQQVRELSQRLQELQQPPSRETAGGDIDEITKRYLKEKLGVVTRDELERMKEDEALEDYLQALEYTYDGSDGRPKFDRKKVLEFCIQHGISNPEDGYKLLHYDELVDWYLRQKQQAPKPPPSAQGKVQREIKPKRRVFGVPTNPEEEVSLREAMLETLEELEKQTGI
jgi:hypothetical protein